MALTDAGRQLLTDAGLLMASAHAIRGASRPDPVVPTVRRAR
ncbi:hypothetical protein [Actinacidiphila yanglinensis]|nr:hypothetical protein [Actinacidiphila yanglinensis]